MPQAGFPNNFRATAELADDDLLFTPNLVYTKGSQHRAFANVAHLDHDASDYAFVS